MANSEKGEVSFKIEDSVFVLRYSTNALCELEDAFGKSAIAVAQELDNPQGVSVKALRTVFRCGLTDDQPGMTDNEAGTLIDKLGIDQVGPLIGQAFTAAFPGAEDVDTEGKP